MSGSFFGIYFAVPGELIFLMTCSEVFQTSNSVVKWVISYYGNQLGKAGKFFKRQTKLKSNDKKEHIWPGLNG